MTSDLKPIHFGISDFHMYLYNAYPNKADCPTNLESMDTEEKEIVDKEKEYIKNYCKNRITAVKISAVVMGVAIGIGLSFFIGTSLGFENIDTLGKIGVIFGGIFGYLGGILMDKYWLASERLAVFYGRITPNRIDRLNKKLNKIKSLISDVIEENLKEKLKISEEFLEKRLKGKEKYSRFFEYVAP